MNLDNFKKELYLNKVCIYQENNVPTLARVIDIEITEDGIRATLLALAGMTYPHEDENISRQWSIYCTEQYFVFTNMSWHASIVGWNLTFIRLLYLPEGRLMDIYLIGNFRKNQSISEFKQRFDIKSFDEETW